MIGDADPQLTPAVEAALNELQGMIAARYPQATFTIEEGFDPTRAHLVATVDIDDTDEVFAVVVDRLVDLQVEADLPIYVIVVRPIARVLAQLRARQEAANSLRTQQSPVDSERRPDSL